MSDRVAVIVDGRVEQVGTPSEIYARPATPYVAAFLGTANLYDATVTGSAGDQVTCDVLGHPLVATGAEPCAVGDAGDGDDPTGAGDGPPARDGDGGPNALSGTVDRLTYRGAHTMVTLDCDDLTLEAEVANVHGEPPAWLDPGRSVSVTLSPTALRVMPPQSALTVESCPFWSSRGLVRLSRGSVPNGTRLNPSGTRLDATLRARRAKSMAIRLARFTSTPGPRARPGRTGRRAARPTRPRTAPRRHSRSHPRRCRLDDAGDQVAPLLVELDGGPARPAGAGTPGPQVEPQPPGAGELLLGLGVARHADQLREPLVERPGLVEAAPRPPGRTTPRTAAAPRSAACPWWRSST